MPTVTLIEPSPELMAKIHEALASVPADRHAQIKLRLDHTGTLTASVAAKGKTPKLEWTVGIFAAHSQAGGNAAGIEGTISFQPAP